MEPLATQQPVQEAVPPTEPEEAAVNGTRATEIHQENIKSTLKEIISEIEEAVVSEVISDSSGATSNFTQVTHEASWILYYRICPTTVANDSYHG
jgi:hypothetical protein